MIPESPAHLLEKTLSSEKIFEGRVIHLRVDQAETPNGREARREVVEHPGGVLALPVLPNDNLLLIQQFRYPLGHPLFEFPAGKLEPGEAPLTAIQRELEEETGYLATHWQELTAIYTSPGFCNERLTLFKASSLELSANPRREEDEFLEVVEKTVIEVAKMIRQRTIIDAKTICAFALVYPEALT